jgi:hypothetical protein
MRFVADAVVSEALEIAAHDAAFITVKLTRALTGRDADYHPTLNDAYGSAKAALISIERSQVVWRLIADASGDQTAAALSDSLTDLRRQVEEAFPKAWSFVAPGSTNFHNSRLVSERTGEFDEEAIGVCR